MYVYICVYIYTYVCVCDSEIVVPHVCAMYFRVTILRVFDYNRIVTVSFWVYLVLCLF